MPELLDFMLAGRARNFVGDVKRAGLQESDLAAVREAAIGALCVEVVPIGCRLPGVNAHMRRIGPTEGSGRSGLVAADDPNRVVRARTAAPVAALLAADVGVSAGVDQDVAIARADHNAKRVGVAVARAPGSERSGVNQDVAIARDHHGDPCVRKEVRSVYWRRGLPCEHLRTEPPDGLLV